MRWLALCLLAVSCSWFPEARPGSRVTIASWNVQNLFDEVDDGTEYSEFDPEHGWNEAQFWSRCDSLSQVIRSLCPGGPDILALEEVESDHAAQVLVGRFLPDLGYQWQTSGADEVGIRTVVLCRFPVVRTAFLRPPVPEGEAPLRGIVEVEVVLGDRPLVVLANHWKSRIPSGAATEELRRASSRVLASRVAELDLRDDHPFVVAVGDFNTSLTLSQSLAARSLVSVHSERGASGSLQVYSNADEARRDAIPGTVWDPWDTVSEPEGSYWYKDRWDRLDHIFISGSSLRFLDWKFEAFEVVAFAARPEPFNPRTNRGISDHFPVLVTLARP